MSDSYTNEAIQAEDREQQLRLKLIDAEKNLMQTDADLESSSKEIEEKLEKLTELNLKLKAENVEIGEKLKKSESELSHQVKVIKNLELVLERLQNGKELHL